MIGTVPKNVSFYIYQPWKGPSIAFAILFLASGCLHVWQNFFKYKSFRIGFILPWAALLFVAGFVLREYGAYHTNNLEIFIASSVLLFVAPPAYNAATYVVAGRVFGYIPYTSPIHPGRVLITFLTLDAIVGILAANGVARASNSSLTDGERNAGFGMVKASLFMLLAMVLGFVYLCALVEHRARRLGVFSRNAKIIMYQIYISSFLILLRTAYRTAASFYSWNSVANGQEWPVWVFEFIPMVFNTYMMNVLPPGNYLPANHKVYLAMDGKTEIEGPGVIDKRPFLLTLFDPFDIGGLVTGKDSKNRFWLTDGIGGPKAEEINETVSKHA